MTDNITYPYVTEDNLTHIQNYQYSKWQGEAFVGAYFHQRSSLLAQMPAPVLWQMPEEACDTILRLWPLVTTLRKGEAVTQAEVYWALVLVKKFEVSKRLYGSYEPDAPHKHCSVEFRAPGPYLLLAEVALLQWCRERCSFWLSAAIKLLDTLCSVGPSLSVSEQAGVAALIMLERVQVTELIKECQ
ncbi:hypothetical protein ACK32A_07390 [Aeromonas enteropelogenes]|uniref:hypothetical protein n=1 Tax=Aeromonas enteropelogenes TaxID=29489 RepID=UPI003988DE1A